MSKLSAKSTPPSASLGFVKAVTEAVKYNSDHWLLYMPRSESKPGRMPSLSKKIFSPAMDSALRETTPDETDAAVMRLCLDDNDVIRRMYLEGRYT